MSDSLDHEGCTKEATCKPTSFEERIAARIADIIVARVIEGLSSHPGGMTKLALHQLPGCRLTGLRLSQFEKFCEIMKADPTTVPYHAAQRALEELPGRGGYKRASSLQRYAIMHKRFW